MQRVSTLESMAVIKIVGVGGGGSNAINRMIAEGITGVDYVVVNTDNQSLLLSDAPVRVRIGDKLTRGLGAGGNPERGGKAASESLDELYQVLQGSDMVFITAGMGGGTGTGAAPIVAKAAREQGALTIGVVTRPFLFEGSKRANAAEHGIEQLREHVDTLIVIPNDRLLELTDKRMSLTESFRMADDVLRQGIQGITELITTPGLINLDFADVRAVMSEGGAALMAVGVASGENRARVAAEQSVSSQLLEVTIDGARGILFNITGGPGMTLFEVNQAAAIIRERAHPDANMIFGAVIDEAMGDNIRITVIATGFDKNPTRRQLITPAVRSEQAVRKTTTNTDMPAAQPKREKSAAPVPEPVAVQQSSSLNGSQQREKAEDMPDGSNREAPARFSPNNLDIPAFLRRR
ncbi:MAG: cell division protein FtsZ [Candidatus Promineifilaceae bacterium]|jgi:cell division protein FtsZ